MKMNDLLDRPDSVYASMAEFERISARLRKLATQIEMDTAVVVRCKDCKHMVKTEAGEYNPEDVVCGFWGSDGLTENDYCSYGERTEE